PRKRDTIERGAPILRVPVIVVPVPTTPIAALEGRIGAPVLLRPVVLAPVVRVPELAGRLSGYNRPVIAPPILCAPVSRAEVRHITRSARASWRCARCCRSSWPPHGWPRRSA